MTPKIKVNTQLEIKPKAEFPEYQMAKDSFSNYNSVATKQTFEKYGPVNINQTVI